MASENEIRSQLLTLLKRISIDELVLDQTTYMSLFKILKQHPKLLYRQRLIDSRDMMIGLFHLPVEETIKNKFDRQSILHFKEEYVKYIDSQLKLVEKIDNLANEIMQLLSQRTMLAEILIISRIFNKSEPDISPDESVQEETE
ncbi:MAG: hypothetical protein ACFFG0_07060 [Candidatus Thorarchaeota archaeon]